ncbi:hypothetical protein OAW18_00740 [Alphaproteobacteria bacterium]|nr:hypothetical protein [Alphaproteobacteria bacterium]
MHPSTKSQIRHIMSDFGETKHHFLHDWVVALAASRWMMPVNDSAIIQIELLHHANQALLSSTVARDGSGPLKASFLPTICRRQLHNLWPINAIASNPHCDGLEITLNLAAQCATRLLDRGISSSQSNRQLKARNDGPIFAEFRL